MQSGPFTVTQTAASSYLLTLSGDIYFDTLHDARRTGIQAAVPLDADVTVDLADVTALDSSSLGLLIALRNDAAAFQVINTPRRLRKLFTIAGLTELLADEDE